MSLRPARSRRPSWSGGRAWPTVRSGSPLPHTRGGTYASRYGIERERVSAGTVVTAGVAVWAEGRRRALAARRDPEGGDRVRLLAAIPGGAVFCPVPRWALRKAGRSGPFRGGVKRRQRHRDRGLAPGLRAR